MELLNKLNLFNFKQKIIIIFLLKTILVECKENYLQSGENSVGLKLKLISMENSLHNTILQLDELKREVTGSIENVDYGYKEKLLEILQSIKEINMELKNNPNNSNQLKNRLNILEDELEKMNLQNDHIVTDLNKYANEQKLNAALSEVLANEFYIAMKNNDIKKALEIFNNYTTDNVYKYLGKFYKNKESLNAFNVLLKFATKVEDNKKKYLIYKYLYNEIDEEENYGFRLLEIIENVKNEIINSNRVTDENLKNDALNFINKLKIDLKKIEINYLKNEIYTKELNSLVNLTYYSDEKLFEDIIKEFLIFSKMKGNSSESYDKLKKFSINKYDVDQRLLVDLIYMSVTLKYDELDSSRMIDLAMKFNAMQLNLGNITGSVGADFNKFNLKFKELIPTSLYNILFAKKHCIKNVGLDEYLKTGGGTTKFFLHDSERRQVYTDGNGRVGEFGIWKIGRLSNGNKFTIKSNKFNEYMYTALTSATAIKEGRRVIWMWIVGGWDDSGEWIFEFNGNNVHIKGSKFNEYLYGSSSTSDKSREWQRGHVYSLTQGGLSQCKQDKNCLWTIEDCSYQ